MPRRRDIARVRHQRFWLRVASDEAVLHLRLGRWWLALTWLRETSPVVSVLPRHVIHVPGRASAWWWNRLGWSRLDYEWAETA